MIRDFQKLSGAAPVTMQGRAAIACAWIILSSSFAFAQLDDCNSCHEVDLEISIHEDLVCGDCHLDVSEDHEDNGVASAACTDCHSDEDDSYALSVHGVGSGNGHQEAATCGSCHGAHDIVDLLDPQSQMHPSRQAKTCGQCHGSQEMAEKFNITKSDPVQLYERSVHAYQIGQGNFSAASCTSCHGAHDILSLKDQEATIFGANLPQTCGTCHVEEWTAFETSVHWEAYQNGVRRTPLCNDCHLEHAILSAQMPDSPTSAAAVPATCGACHDDAQVTQRYGLAAYRLESYYTSYHGLALAGGGEDVASCVSCHGEHAILSAANPNSTVHPDNIAGTCGSCHPGIGSEIVIGSIHENQPGTGGKVIGMVRQIYTWLIVITVVGMLLHNGLDLRKKIKQPQAIGPLSGKQVVRFNATERTLHWSTLSSFIILAWSGFGLAWPESIWGAVWTESMRGLVHRTASVVLLGAAAAHFILMAITKRGRGQASALFPRLRDFSDLKEMIRYYIGKRSDRPKFMRYSYIEKVEYWALLWGIVVMAITGVGLWLDNPMLYYFPKWWLDLFTVIHLYEAILACLAIAVWHFYWVIFDPEVYPGSGAFWHGNIPVERYEHHHADDREMILQAKELS